MVETLKVIFFEGTLLLWMACLGALLSASRGAVGSFSVATVLKLMTLVALAFGIFAMGNLFWPSPR